MVQHDHAVRDELLYAVPGQLAGTAPLGGNDRGQSFLLEPVEQAVDFGAQDTWVWQLAEERFNGVQHDSPRPDLLDSVGNSNEEAIEVILAGFRNLASRDGHVVQEQLLLRHQPVQVETQRSDIRGQVRDRLLERHEHAGFVVLCGAPNQELQSEQCLSGTGASTDQSGTPGWQPSPRDFVQTLDSGAYFRQRLERLKGLKGLRRWLAAFLLLCHSPRDFVQTLDSGECFQQRLGRWLPCFLLFDHLLHPFPVRSMASRQWPRHGPASRLTLTKGATPSLHRRLL